MFKVGIITVPSRKEAVKLMTDHLDILGIEYIIFNDEEYNGQPYNFTRLLKHFCEGEFKENIVLCTDDLLFKSGWLNKILAILLSTEYDVISGYSNRIQNKHIDVYNGTGKHCLYDPIVCYRAGFLTKEYYDGFIKYTQSSERTSKEHNHYDVMHSHYIRDNNYKVCVIRPNIVSLQDIASTLGHSVMIK